MEKIEYEIFQKKQGNWHSPGDRDMTYYHLIIKTSIEDAGLTDEEVYHLVKDDLEPIFGDMAPRSRNKALLAAALKKQKNFWAVYVFNYGIWLIDIHLFDQFTDVASISRLNALEHT